MRIRHVPVAIALAVPLLVAPMAFAEDAAPSLDEREAVNVLGEAVTHLDEMPSLPESAMLSRDRDDASEDIDALMDEALEVLDLPGIREMRSRYRELEEEIAETRVELASLREARVFAKNGDPSMLAKFTPTDTLKQMTATTRADYDELIESKQSDIESLETALAEERERLAEGLSEIGIEMDPDQLELWLSSVIGDDVMSMSVVFQSIRQVTLRLEELTAESGEDLAFAKRYYGMVVILHKLIVRMQETFIHRVDNEVLPKLDAYREEADDIIAESRRLIREGGNRESLERNIESNRLTQEAIDLYERVVRDQRDKVAEALEISRQERDVATNTYRTVQLSSNVTSLIREGADTFKTLSSLQVPATAAFKNEAMREEFRKLTERMTAGD